MADAGTVWVKFGGDTSGFKKGQKEVSQGIDNTKKQASDLTGAFGGLAKAAAGAFSVGMVINFGKEMIAVTGEFQKYEAVLRTTLGSSKAAAASMSMLQRFAAETPFQLNELTNSYVKLANRGLKPTKQDLTQLGDLASSTGKSFDQLTEGVMDAMTGENERMKEFGIVARDLGDKWAYTFKGVTTEVAKSSTSIYNYILGLGKMTGVAGSMASISETLTGRISNMRDAWDGLLYSLGTNSNNIFSKVIASITTLYGKLTLLSELAGKGFQKSYALEVEQTGIAYAKDAKDVDEYRAKLVDFIKIKKEYQRQLDQELNDTKKEGAKLGNQLAIGGHGYWEEQVKIKQQIADGNRDATTSLDGYLKDQDKLVKLFKDEHEVVKSVVIQTKEQIEAAKKLAEKKLTEAGLIGGINALIEKNNKLIEQAKSQDVINNLTLENQQLEVKKKNLEDIAYIQAHIDGTTPTVMKSKAPGENAVYTPGLKDTTAKGSMVGIQKDGIKTIEDAEDELAKRRDKNYNDRIRQIHNEGKVAIDMEVLIKDAQVKGFADIGDSLGKLFSGELTVKGFFNNILVMVADFMKSFGDAMIAAGVASEAFQALLPTNPVLAIGAGIALVAAAGFVKSTAQKGLKGYENGGVFYGPTVGIFGEYAGARSNPEVAGKLSDIKGLMNNNIQVEMVLRGEDLVSSVSRVLDRKNRL